MTINSLSTNKAVSVNHSSNARQDPNRAEPKIIAAAKECDIDKLLSAIDDGVDINVKDSRGYTPLMILADFGDIEGVSLLIKRGADVKVESGVEGYTALMIAANSMDYFNRESAVLSALVAADSSPEHLDHACPRGVTAFMLAVHSGNKELALKLQNAGADVNKQNNDGFSALSHASAEGEYETVLWLMEQNGWFSKGQVRDALDVTQSETVKGIFTDFLRLKRGNFVADSSISAVVEQVGKRPLPMSENSNMAPIFKNNPGSAAAENTSAPSPRTKQILPRTKPGLETAPEALGPGPGIIRKLPPVEDDDQVRHQDKKSRTNSSEQSSAGGQISL